MHQRLVDLSDTFPFVLAEDRSEDPSRVAGELVAMVLGRVLEILTVEGQPWVPVGSTVGPQFLAGIRGSPQKIRQRWVPVALW